MSAIDFDMAIERVAIPTGDRVRITMSGKFLPYKYCASGNVPEYGFKEGEGHSANYSCRAAKASLTSLIVAISLT
jgi:Cyanate lyase C-terminal domain